MRDWDPRENPLVERAFRIGFRSGPGSFRLGWYIAGLGLATVGPFLPRGLSAQWTVRDAATWMLPALLGLLLLVFVIGGFQRMLSSFAQERERGTFDFLHLSTLRSGAIVLGFLLAGQLPGYFALVLISPLLVLAAHFSEFPLLILAAMIASLVFAVLALSVFFLFFGFWAKKVTEFRGAAFIYASIYCFGGWLVANGIVKAGILPDRVPHALLGAPILFELYGLGRSIADATGGAPPGIAPLELYGAGLAPWVFAIVVALPATAIVFLALCRSLRHRDRAPWSISHATLLFAWCVFALVGTWWGTGIPLRMRCISLAVFAWMAIRRLTDRGTPSRTRTVHALGRSGGGLRSLLRSEEGPPLRLSLALVAVWWGGSLLLASEAWLDPDSIESIRSSGPPLLFALAPALFLLPLASLGLFGQWLAWHLPALRWSQIVVSLFVVLGPFLAFLFGPTLAELPLVSSGFLAAYGSLSPFSHILSLARGSDPGPFAGAGVLLGQVPHAVACGILAILIRSAGREIAERSRRLLAGLDGSATGARRPGRGPSADADPGNAPV